MIETDSKLSELSAQVERYPQALVNVAVASKPPLEDLEHVREAIIDVERKLGSLGRVLVRYSGTENICRVMVEGPKAVHVQQYAKAIAKTIQHALAS